MPTLSQVLGRQVQEWRDAGYPNDFPEVSEILGFQKDDDGRLRFLRRAQLEAIEVYFYLRTVLGTRHVFELYREFFEDDLLAPLGIPSSEEILKTALKGGQDAIFEKIRKDDDFVQTYKLETVREMMTLDYPSYILALAMGAGKTILIGTIIAFEFALALETKDPRWLRNALVFAPGKTILRSLRELQQLPFESLLPPRFSRQVAQNLKFVVASEAKTLPVIPDNNYYVIITNTEKIRLQNRPRRRKNQTRMQFNREAEEVEAEANLRLQQIASLKSLGIFSDEAHGLYGQQMNKEIKKVRQTVDYIADNTDVRVVVNTTGTPYFQKQMLKEVVYWYGLAEGIEDGILKSVKDSIRGYAKIDDENFLREVLTDFFAEYKDVKTQKGIPAKLAVYFPQVEDLQKARAHIEVILTELGESPSILTQCHSKASQAEQDAFARFHLPESPHRIVLLVGMGTEGWNCPALFACALAREISGSNNLVLQTSTRCLRQVPGNTRRARIYLSEKNLKTLDSQFQQTYGITLLEASRVTPAKRRRIVLRKPDPKPLEMDYETRYVTFREDFRPEETSIAFQPFPREEESYEKYAATVSDTTGKILLQEGTEVVVQKARFSPRTVAARLSRKYRLPFFAVLQELHRIAGGIDFTEGEIGILSSQIEAGFGNRFQVETKRERVRLALVKKKGFQQDEEGNYFAEIRYSPDREDLVCDHNAEPIGFHYTPYNFDSTDEKDFFYALLAELGESPDNVEDIYYTGAISSPEKTDFWFWYKGIDDKWHRYTPDFLIRRKDGRIFIVEIKPTGDTEENRVTQQKQKKLQEIVSMNPDSVQFEIIEGFSHLVQTPQIKRVRHFVS